MSLFSLLYERKIKRVILNPNPPPVGSKDSFWQQVMHDLWLPQTVLILQASQLESIFPSNGSR